MFQSLLWLGFPSCYSWLFCTQIFKVEDDEEVDVVSLDPCAVYCSSDDDDNDGSSYVTDLTAKKGPLWYYPYPPEIEEPEENPFSMLINIMNHSQSD